MKALWQKLWQKTGDVIPEAFLRDPELNRRARLISRFGLLGSVFGFAYAAFYFVIGHRWGVGIIIGCSLAVASTPFIMIWSRSLNLAGNLLSLVLTLGFTALCCVEGGLHGHAIAWLVSVPLCALLLVGKTAAKWWVVICLLATTGVAGADLAGFTLPMTYDPAWNSLVSTAGYLGLIVFMFILGAVFETGRERAFAKMAAALTELATSNERLLHLNKEKNEFLGIAAHDLKNPLTAIIGSAELLPMAKDQARVAQCARMIVSAGTRMRDLITNLLDANAIEEGRFTSKVERLDLQELVEESVEHNRPASTRKEINIQVCASGGLWAKADRGATLQILDNLISNALKYSPPKTTVHIHTLPEADSVVVGVKDEGPGISEEDQKKLFQKFTRLSARPTGGESSTGLGLSIVKRLAEAMSGAVQCHSVLGFGTTFKLRLPAWPGETGKAPSPTTTLTQHPTESETSFWIKQAFGPAAGASPTRDNHDRQAPSEPKPTRHLDK